MFSILAERRGQGSIVRPIRHQIPREGFTCEVRFYNIETQAPQRKRRGLNAIAIWINFS